MVKNKPALFCRPNGETTTAFAEAFLRRSLRVTFRAPQAIALISQGVAIEVIRALRKNSSHQVLELVRDLSGEESELLNLREVTELVYQVYTCEDLPIRKYAGDAYQIVFYRELLLALVTASRYQLRNYSSRDPTLEVVQDNVIELVRLAMLVPEPKVTLLLEQLMQLSDSELEEMELHLSVSLKRTLANEEVRKLVEDLKSSLRRTNPDIWHSDIIPPYREKIMHCHRAVSLTILTNQSK